MINELLRYFDLQSENRSVAPEGHSAGNVHAPVLPQYLALSAGVVIEPLLHRYIESGSWQFDLSSLVGRLFFGLVIGVVILPGVYKSSFDAQKPVLIQLAALFPLGVGWQSLFTSVTKLTTG